MQERWRRGTTTIAAAGGALIVTVLIVAGCGSGTDSTTTDAGATVPPTADVMPTITPTVQPASAVPTADTGPTPAETAPAPALTPAALDSPTSDNPGLSLSGHPLTLRGMGTLEMGMTLDEAIVATGLTIAIRGDSAEGAACRYAQVVGDPESPWLMVVGAADGLEPETIVRIELAGSSSTLSGIHIGSTKDDVLAAYGDRIEVSPHKYTFAEGGEYLTFVPADAADADYRLIFETLDDKVTEIRSGLLPAVEWVEGCL